MRSELTKGYYKISGIPKIKSLGSTVSNALHKTMLSDNTISPFEMRSDQSDKNSMHRDFSRMIGRKSCWLKGINEGIDFF